jgi:hypothetical protein
LGAGGSSSGAFAVDAGATLTFGTFLDSNHLLSGDSTVSGDGNVVFNAGTVTVLGRFELGGTVTITNNAVVSFSSDANLQALTMTGGTLVGSGNVTVSGPLLWTGGTMRGPGITTANGTLVMSGPSVPGPNLQGRTLNNAGTATWTGTSVSVGGGGVFNNLAGATFLVRSDGNFGGLEGGVFNNAGDIVKNGSSNLEGFGLPFNNTGTVEVETGTFFLGGSGTIGGSLSVSAGATLSLSGPSLLDPSASLTGAGTVQLGSSFSSGGTTILTDSWTVANILISNNGTVNFAVDVHLPGLTLAGGTLTGTGNVTVEGTFTWTWGVMFGVGSTTSLGTADLSGSFASRDLNGRTLFNAGTMTWTGTTEFSIFNGGMIDNQPGGVFAIHGDATLRGEVTGDPTGTFVNEGTLVKEASSQTTTIRVPFTNVGTVQLQTGTLSFSAGYLQQDGSTEIASGTSLTVAGVGLNLQGGVLSGTGTVNGNLVNAGLVTPGGDGTAGTLTVTGSYTQTDSGVLSIDLGGLTAGSGYDQLLVSGPVTLGGTLRVQLINAFQPFPGDTFSILTFSSRTGDFAVDQFPDLGTSRTMTPTFSATTLALVIGEA